MVFCYPEYRPEPLVDLWVERRPLPLVRRRKKREAAHSRVKGLMVSSRLIEIQAQAGVDRTRSAGRGLDVHVDCPSCRAAHGTYTEEGMRSSRAVMGIARKAIDPIDPNKGRHRTSSPPSAVGELYYSHAVGSSRSQSRIAVPLHATRFREMRTGRGNRPARTSRSSVAVLKPATRAVALRSRRSSSA